MIPTPPTVVASRAARPRASDLLAAPGEPAPAPADVLRDEDAYLDDLFAVAADKAGEREDLVYYAKDPKSPTGVRVKVKFAIRVLESEEITKIRAVHTTAARTGPDGRHVPERFDQEGYRSNLIYAATDDADKARLWDNPRYRTLVPTGWMMIDKVLKPGEKVDALGRVFDLAGFGALPEPAVEEAVGNS